MYLILSNADYNATSLRASEVFHNGVDVTGLRTAGEEKVQRWRSDREGPTKKVRRRRSNEEEDYRKREHDKNLTHGSDTL